ncbi:hypothetical protein KJ059_10180 [Myxococcota bacterium]|nr:hypothetical protein [Myxococcota bacterium]
MTVRASELIDPAARQHLEAVVLESERHTVGEIVVAVVSACEDDHRVGWRLGVVAAAAALVGTSLFVPGAPWWALLAIQATAFCVAYGMTRLPAVRRQLLPADLIEARVQGRARRCFREQGLTRTRGRTGILLFVTLLERRVVVLADEGIDRVLGPGETWGQVVDLVTAGLRAGRGVDGLEAAVRRCGEILAQHAPRSTERGIDELPNAIVVED